MCFIVCFCVIFAVSETLACPLLSLSLKQWLVSSASCWEGQTSSQIPAGSGPVFEATVLAYKELVEGGLLPDGCQQHFTCLWCAVVPAHRRVSTRVASFTPLEMGVWKRRFEEVEEEKEKEEKNGVQQLILASGRAPKRARASLA